MGRAKLASANIVFGLIENVVNTILGFISRAIFIQVLGAEILGIEAVFTNLIQMLSLAELGITSVMNFSYYEPLAKGDTKKLRGLVSFYKKLYLGIAFVVLVIGLALIPFLPNIVNVDQSLSNITLFYVLFVGDSVISYLFVYRTTILRADQKTYLITRYEIITNIVRTIGQIIALLVTGSYVAYLLIKICSTLLWNYLSARKAKKLYPELFSKKEKLDTAEKKKIFTVLKSGFIYKVSIVFLNSTTNVILSVLVSTIIVGYLSNYNLVVVAVVQISAIIFTNLTASIGNLVVLENEQSRLNVFKSMITVGSWLTVVFVGCTAVLCNGFIALWLGEDLLLPLHTELLRMGWMFLECIMQPIFAYREAVGLYQKTRYIMLAAAGLNIILSITLGMLFGLDGILCAAILSRLATYFWYEPRILYRDYFCASPLPYFKEVLFAFALTIIVVFFGIMVREFLIVSSWTSWLCLGAIIFVFSNLVCMLIYSRRPAFRSVLAMVVGIIKQENKNDQ